MSEEVIMTKESEAIAKRDTVVEKVGELKAALRDYSAFREDIGDLLNGITGLDYRDLPNTAAVDEMQKALRRFSGDVPVPLPRSMFPQEGQQQPRVRTPGGWVSRANYESSQAMERKRAEDPEREAQQARRNPAPVR